MKQKYGATKTHLTLTPKAQRYYNGADSIEIYEHPGMMYTIKAYPDPETAMMTEEDVNAMLEAWQDEIDKLEEDEQDE